MDDHLSWLYVAVQLMRILAGPSEQPVGQPPCSRRGLPPPKVTRGSCGLLPRSFHPYPNGRYRFCGTFPRLGRDVLSRGTPPTYIWLRLATVLLCTVRTFLPCRLTGSG